MSVKVGDLYFESGIKTAGFNRDAAKMESRIGQSTKKISGMGANMGKGLSGGLAKFGINPIIGGVAAVGAALGAVAKQAHDFSKEFDTAMLEVKTISSAVTDDFEGMKQGVMDISFLPIKDGAVDLTGALYQIVSAGHDGADGLMVLEAAAKAATGGVTETVTAADGLTTVLNAWGLEASHVNEVSDVMFTAVKLGKTTMGELSSSIAQVAPLASSMGVSFEEVFAAVATLTKQGTPTAQAMTQIRSSLVNMNKALGEGWSDQMTYQEGLQKIAEMAGGSQQELKKLIPDIEGMNAVLGMTGEKAAGAAADLDKTYNSAEATNTAFEIMAKSTDVLKQQTFNKLNAELEKMGGLLVNAENHLYSFLSAALTSADSLGDEFSEIGETVEGFSERMKVLRNEGNGFFGAITGALFKSDEKVQGIVDSEKAEIQATKDEIKALQEEYARMQSSGATDEQLSAFKANLQKRYEAILEATEKENEAQKKDAKQSKIFAWATLGLGTNTASREAIKAKDKQDEVDAYKQIFDAVAGLGVEAEKKVADAIDGTKNSTEESMGVIKALEEELKTLQDNTGTFTNPEAEARNLDAIREKTLELRDAWSQVREHYARSINMDGIGEMKEAKGVKVTGVTPVDPKPIKDSLAPMKKLTDEEEKQLKATNEKLDAERSIEMQRAAQIDMLNDMSKVLSDSAGIFDAMAYTAGKFDEELGKSLGSMSAIAGDAANFVANMASGNWVGAVQTGIGLIGTVVGELSMSQEEQNRLAEEYNQILSERIDLLVGAGIITEWEGATQSKEQFENDLELVRKKVSEFQAFISTTRGQQREKLGNVMELVFGEEWTHDDLLQVGDDIDAFILKYNEIAGLKGIGTLTIYDRNELQQLINDYSSAIRNIKEANDEIASIVLGFNSDDISSSILDGIMEGLRLSEDGLGDFADGFQDLMERAARQAMTKSMEKKYIDGIIDKFEAAMATGNVIDDDEMADLQKDYAEAVKSMKDQADAWAHVIGEQTDNAKDEGLSGAVKGISEETAGMIEGRMNSIQMNIIGLKEIQQSQLSMLEAIRHNTSYNFHLEELSGMANDLKVMRQRQNDLISSIKDSNNGGVVI